MTDNRIHVPDPALMRRAGNRMILALVAILIFATPFTIWGIVLLAAGELPGLPLAVGGAVLEIATVVLVVTTLRIRSTLDHDTISRESLLQARRVARGVRLASLTTVLALIAYGLIRGLTGEWWSLLTALLIGVALYLLGSGAKNIVRAQDRSLA